MEKRNVPDEQVVEQTQEQIAVESDAAFADGFNTARGTPPAEEKPEPKVEAKTEEAPKTDAPEAKAEEPDPWKDVNPVVKAELESMRGKLAAVDKIPDRLRNIEGHIGGLTSQLKTALATAKAVEKTGAEAPTQAQVQSAAASSAKWKQLQEDFPDWAEAMDARLAEVRAAIPKAPEPIDVASLKNEVRSEVKTEVATSVKEAVQQARQLGQVDTKHPGWEERINTPAFEAWFNAQAPEIQALGGSPKAADAIKLLDAFEAASKKAEEDRKKKEANDKRLKDAMTPKGAAAQPSTLNDEDAFEQGFQSVRGG